MWISAASRVVMFKQRMKERSCRESVMRTAGEECIYLVCTNLFGWILVENRYEVCHRGTKIISSDATDARGKLYSF